MDNRIVCYHSSEEFIKRLSQFDLCSNPFQSLAFYSVYLKFHEEHNYYFFDIYHHERLIGIVPFVCTLDSSLFNIKYFRFIGYRQFNYEQYICKDDDIELVHSLFTDYLKKQKYRVIINYYDINDSSILYQLLQKSKDRKTANKLYVCPCLLFENDFDSFFKSVYPTSKKRAELKKFQKKLSTIGNLKIINVLDKQSYEENLSHLNQIYKIHSERFANVYATSFFGSKKMRPYYTSLIQSLMNDKKGFISLLLLNDVVIAFIFCLTNGKNLIDWIPAFDPAFSKYSLGIVQYKMLFEEMCSQKYDYKSFDYSKGASVYKRKWAKLETINYQFLYLPTKQNFFSSFIYLKEKYKFHIKCYLREKGILKSIKSIMGKTITLLNKKGEKRKTIHIEYIHSSLNTTIIDYSSLINYPIYVREAILDAYYKGEKLISLKEEGKRFVIVLYKEDNTHK